MTAQGFGERLVEAGREYGRLCVGIDPHAALLAQWGLEDTVEGLRAFSETCVEAFAGHAAVVKPQVAFFERFGSAGYAVLEDTLAQLRESGTLVIADAKRGDIGSTMAGYAAAWLAPGSPLEADALTLTPYLGVGSLDPAIELAAQHGKGVFVMAANSNPEAVALQTGTIDGKMLAQRMVDECAEYNRGDDAEYIGHVGVVVGATVQNPPVLDQLNAPVLMPGVGAQGATMDDAQAIAGEVGHLVFPSVSRSVLAAGPEVAELRKRVSDLGKQAKG
ncbi:orotidine 5'-phosphate decarboxylase [Corynebacterium afermentans subsp. afermentans]|uniref:Orotidine-5'-phosphate decarboxylase n=1 Tax=Corynebacterium afermentans TaxID=38286 RepID=A0A9X8NA68_9CORY|nr:orotidine-5'-phosphate decarboxylase [Corynebacterium afermentans]OAA17710.1 orotidine 5'-phosphate decarboxylase [Corynebacterium afermentans subsp. afermentans]WJY56843.1 orotidine 5'-phosphate decarboxylase [Corynebacterium afermentans subsp. afermentans]SIP86930.1 orotidine-5'-phosphate decarboxylase [Corynebacterium afermentans]